MAEEVYQGFFEASLSCNLQDQELEPSGYQLDYSFLSLGYQPSVGIYESGVMTRW
jgi:hypothetical protein